MYFECLSVDYFVLVCIVLFMFSVDLFMCVGDRAGGKGVRGVAYISNSNAWSDKKVCVALMTYGRVLMCCMVF